MTTQNGKGTVEEFQGEKQNPPIEYTYTFSKYDSLTEAKASEDWPSENEILKWVNQTAERTAKASEYQKATKSLREAYEKSDAFTYKEMVKLLLLRGKTQAEAEAIAKNM